MYPADELRTSVLAGVGGREGSESMAELSRAELLELLLTEYSYAAVLADPARLQVWEDLGLTMSQLRVLHILNADPGMTAGNLAERLGVRPSTVTGIVDRLVKQDLVERRSDPEDRRVVRNLLTVRGTEVLSDLARAGREYIMNILEPLSNEELLSALSGLGGVNRKAQEMGLQVRRDIPLPASPMP